MVLGVRGYQRYVHYDWSVAEQGGSHGDGETAREGVSMEAAVQLVLSLTLLTPSRPPCDGVTNTQSGFFPFVNTPEDTSPSLGWL